MPKIVTIVLDPYMLLRLSSRLPEGALINCTQAYFAVSDYLQEADFRQDVYQSLVDIIDREKIARLSFLAMNIADLLSLRDSLALHQVASIAAAREHACFFASECPVFRRKAASVLAPSRVLDEAGLHGLLGLA